MGLFSFIKDAGEKLFGGKEAQAATVTAAAVAAAPAAPATPAELNAKAARAIETYITAQNLGASALQVDYDAAHGKVTVNGEAPTQAAKEKPPPSPAGGFGLFPTWKGGSAPSATRGLGPSPALARATARAVAS